MSTTIQLITPEALTAQWKQLDAAKRQTEAMMTAMNIPIPSRTVAAINTASSDNPSKLVKATEPVQQKAREKRGTNSELVREYYALATGSFTIAEVRDFLSQKYPEKEFTRTALSAALSYDAETGKLRLVKQGGSGRSSVYQTLPTGG